MSIVNLLNQYVPLDLAKMIFSYRYPYKYVETKTEEYVNKCSNCKGRSLKYANYFKNENNEIVILGITCVKNLFGINSIKKLQNPKYKIDKYICSALLDINENVRDQSYNMSKKIQQYEAKNIKKYVKSDKCRLCIHYGKMCYNCKFKLQCIKNGKNPMSLIKRNCDLCATQYTIKRFEKYKKKCMDCYLRYTPKRN